MIDAAVCLKVVIHPIKGKSRVTNTVCIPANERAKIRNILLITIDIIKPKHDIVASTVTIGDYDRHDNAAKIAYFDGHAIAIL